MNSNSTSRTGRWAVGIGLAFALAIGAVSGSLMTAKSGHLPFIGSTSVPIYVATTSGVPGETASFAAGFAGVIAKVVPAVVNIASSKIVVSQKDQLNPSMNPMFRQFFGDQSRVPREKREKSLGSGVIISPEGYIMTNNHVVSGASEITVTLSNKKDYKARIVGTDPKTDIAVVKVDAQNLPFAILGNSTNVQVGEFALAVGSPFGLSQTVTMGIISAKGRVNLGIEDYEDFIQTDTAINPGNSGGALVNSRGELIGINTAIVAGNTGNQGVGFAIPINMAREVMAQILKHGKVIRGYLGAWIQPVTPEIAKAFNLKEATGALLGDVEPGSPAARSGLQRGDVIESINDEPVTDSESLRMKIAMTAPGSRVKLKVSRSGSERTVEVVLQELSTADEIPEAQGKSERQQSLQGLSIENLTPSLAKQLLLRPGTKGVVVTNVESGTLADEAGVVPGDIIVEINRRPISDVEDYRRAVAAVSGAALLLISREGNTLYVAVK